MTKHMRTKTKEYKYWNMMKQSCYNPRYTMYNSYGAKGVTVCREWLEDFMVFLADMGKVPDGATRLDVIDPVAGFCKGNVRWVYRQKPKKIKSGNLAICSVSIDAKHYEYIMNQLRNKSAKEGKLCSFSGFVRDVLEQHIPLPKTKDMFSKEKKKASDLFY